MFRAYTGGIWAKSFHEGLHARGDATNEYSKILKKKKITAISKTNVYLIVIKRYYKTPLRYGSY